jgi:hypothetical protein
VVLTTHPLLAPRSRKTRDIPLPPLWAFVPVTGYLFLLIDLSILGTDRYEEEKRTKKKPGVQAHFENESFFSLCRAYFEH